MAERLGVSRGKLANYEQGSRQPDYETLQQLADYFDVTTDYLLGRTSISETTNIATGKEKNLTTDEEFEVFANNPELERWYKELPKSEEDDLQALKQMWEIIKKNKK